MEAQNYRPNKNEEYVQILICEFTGTMILTAAINYAQNDPYAMGVIVAILSTFFWVNSGAYFNPALTLAIKIIEPSASTKFMAGMMAT